MNPIFAKFRETKYIRLDPRQCDGCWDCVAACPRQVLGAIKGGPRHHVHVVNAEACNGCKKCVRACENGAIEYIYTQRPKENKIEGCDPASAGGLKPPGSVLGSPSG